MIRQNKNKKNHTNNIAGLDRGINTRRTHFSTTQTGRIGGIDTCRTTHLQKQTLRGNRSITGANDTPKTPTLM